MELNEFQGNRWLETARWLGYEENFNPRTVEWGPSHVSFLTFKSLLQLRKIMSTGERGSPPRSTILSSYVPLKAAPMCSGVFLLDLKTSNLSMVAERVVDELLTKNEIRAGDRESLLRALLMRRRFILVS